MIRRSKSALSRQDYQRLMRLQTRIAARDFLASHNLYGEGSHADARLAFAKWLYAARRINEGLPRGMA